MLDLRFTILSFILFFATPATALNFPRSFLIPADKLSSIFIPTPPLPAAYTYVELLKDARILQSSTRSLPLPPAPKTPTPDFGVYDNLPPQIFTSSTPKTSFFNKLQKPNATFQSTLSQTTGYKIMASIVEPLSVTVNSVCLAGAVVIVSEIDGRSYFVETHIEEAIGFSTEENLPIYVDTEFWESLSSSQSSASPSTPESFNVPVSLPNAATMSPEELERLPPTDQSFLLLSPGSSINSPSQLPRPRFLKTKEGSQALREALLPLLDSATRNVVEMKLAMERNDVVRVAELEKDKSDKLFAMERMREAKKKGQLRLYKVWSDRLKLLQSLDGDGYLESKDEWYEETRLKNVKRLENSNSSEGLDELLKGTSLDPNNDE